MTEAKKPLKKPRGKARLIAGQVHRLRRPLPERLPGRCHRDERGRRADHRRREMHRLRQVRQGLPGRRRSRCSSPPRKQEILAELAGSRARRPKRSMPKKRSWRKKLAAYRGVWVFVEQTEGEAAKVSWELLGNGRELAETLGSRTLPPSSSATRSSTSAAKPSPTAPTRST